MRVVFFVVVVVYLRNVICAGRHYVENCIYGTAINSIKH